MDKYRVRASFNDNQITARSTSTFQSKPFPQLSLPTKPPISSYLHPQSLGRATADAELSIFDAKRYFKDGGANGRHNNSTKMVTTLNGIVESCDYSTNPMGSSFSSADDFARNWQSQSFRATPTASSQASWNSRAGLLTNRPCSVAVSVKAFHEKRRHGSNSLSAGRRFFGRNCHCYGKKSVDVMEKPAEPKGPVRFSSDKISTVTSASVDTSSVAPKEVEEASNLKISAATWANDPIIFSPDKPFPEEISHRIINSGRPFVESAGFSFQVLTPSPAASAGSDQPPRESLEVFRPKAQLNLRRSDEFARMSLPEAVTDDDVASDSSSDLFEIESFSAHYAFRHCDTLDELPKVVGNPVGATGILQLRRNVEETAESIAPSDFYAPSEASVEWSLTTAKGEFDQTSMANFSSAASDYGDVQFIGTERGQFGQKAGKVDNKKGRGGLLSCRCENSVSVGPIPVRIGPEQRRPGNLMFSVEPDKGNGMSWFPLEKVRRPYPAQTR